MSNSLLPLKERKAALTRRVILESCRRLFAIQGYAETTMNEIAAEAGVAVQTVYTHIGGKAALLVALLDWVDEIAQVQDTQRQIGESEDAVTILTLTAQLRRRIMEQTGDIVSIVGAARSGEPELQQAWADAQQRSYTGVKRIVAKLAVLEALRDDIDEVRARDVMYTILHPANYSRLVEECGWTHQAVEDWLSATLRQLLLTPD